MYKKLLILLGVLFACINCSHIFRVDYNTPIDFRNVYLGAKIWGDQQNPYIDSVLKNEWYRVCDAESIDKNQPPGLPQNFLVYPPSALLLFYPISFLPWKIAVWVNVCIALFSLLTLLYLMCIWVPDEYSIPFASLLLIILAFKGTMHALVVGQPSFIANALALGGVYLALKKNKLPWAIFLLILASFKPTSLLPYLLFLAYKKQWKLLIFTGIGSGVLLGLSLLYLQNPLVFVDSFLFNIGELKALIFGSDTTYFLHSITELRAVTSWLFYGDTLLYKIVYVLLATMLGYVLWKNRQLHDHYVLTLLIIFCLLVTHHLFYDVLFIFPILWIYPKYNNTIKGLLLVCSISFFIPVNGILDRLHLPATFDFLSFTTPFSLFMLFVILMYNPINDKIGVFSHQDESLH